MRLPLDRQTLLKYLPRGVAVEVGVGTGNFSQEIIKYNKPKDLYLIDVWRNISLDYVDINMVSNEEQEVRYLQVKKKFEGLDNVHLIRMLSLEAATSFGPSAFDWVFIDADHSYEGCLADLRSFDSKVSSSGYICGHDWLPDGYDVEGFGVNQAVKTFVSEKGYILSLVTHEPKYQSFVVSKTESAHNHIIRSIRLGEGLDIENSEFSLP